MIDDDVSRSYTAKYLDNDEESFTASELRPLIVGDSTPPLYPGQSSVDAETFLRACDVCGGLLLLVPADKVDDMIDYFHVAMLHLGTAKVASAIRRHNSIPSLSALRFLFSLTQYKDAAAFSHNAADRHWW